MSNPIYVTRLDDDAAMEGTLRYAVAQVNAGSYDSIIIDASLAGETITLLSDINVYYRDCDIRGTDTTIKGKSFGFAGGTISGIKFDLESETKMKEWEMEELWPRNRYLNCGIIIEDKGARLLDFSVVDELAGTIKASADLSASAEKGARVFTDSGDSNNYVAGMSIIAVANGYWGDCSVKCNIGKFTGNFSVTNTGGGAYGFVIHGYSLGDESAYPSYSKLNIESCSGKISVTATEVVGIHISNHSWNYDIVPPNISEASVTIDNFSGEINLNATAGDAVGMNTAADGNTASMSSITINSFSGAMNITASGNATGFYATIVENHWTHESRERANITNFSGSMSITAKGGTASVGADFHGDFSGNVTVAAVDYAEGVGGDISDFSGKVTVTSKNKSVSAVSASGVSGNVTVIADGAEKNSACKANTVSTNGLIAAGCFKTWETETGMSDFISALNLRNESIIEKAVLAAKNQTAVSGSSAMEYKDGAFVLGDLTFNGEGSTLTVSSGARLYGNVTANTLSATFQTGLLTTRAVLTVSQDGALTSDGNTYTIETSSKASTGSYIFVGGLTEGALSQKTFTVKIDDETFELNPGNEIKTGGRKYALTQLHTALVFTILPSDYDDTTAPTQVLGVKMDVTGETSRRFSWADSSDDVGVALYQVSFGNQNYYTNERYLYLDKIADGSYEYKVRALDCEFCKIV